MEKMESQVQIFTNHTIKQKYFTYFHNKLGNTLDFSVIIWYNKL